MHNQVNTDKQLKILITDDDPENLELLDLILSREYEVIQASSGEECLKQAKEHLPDLILLDVMMPEMDGYDVLKEQQKDHEISHIPTIFLTARYKDLDRVTRGWDLGAFDYITKPFEDDILMARIKTAMQYKQSEDERRYKNTELKERMTELALTYDELEIESKKLVSYSNSVAEITNLIEAYGKGEDCDIPEELNHSSKKLFETFKSTMDARDLAEKKLIRKNRQLKLHRKQTYMGIIEWDNDFVIKAWNRAAERIFGYTKEEALGKKIIDLVFAPAEQNAFRAIRNELLERHKFIQHLTKNTSKKEGQHICEWSSTPIIQEDNTQSGIISMVNDITARQKANDEVAQQREELELILNNMVDAVVSIDDNGYLLSFNKAAEDLFQYKKEDVLGENIEILIPKKYHKRHKKFIKSFAATGAPIILGNDREIIGLKANGEEFPLRLKISPLPDNLTDKKKFMASCQDITLEKEQEIEKRRNQTVEALGKLTSGIAHDYNNLLSIILGYSNILAGPNVNENKVKNYVQEIIHAGERGRALTNKLLSFTRKDQIKPEAVNINDVILGDQHMLEATLTARINLDINLDKKVDTVYTDRSEVSDLLLNMSINAMHAIESEGTLSISTKRINLTKKNADKLNIKAGDYCLLKIADNGVGMDKKVISHVFDPFFTTKGENGTGLGLSQVYGVMKRCGGDIKVTSKIGKGTEFSLYFPTYKEKKETKQNLKSDKKMELDNEAIGTILIIDDNESILRMNEDILSMQGYDVITSACVDEALRILETTKINLILSDVTMPIMNGFDLAKIVRKKYPDIKIQLVSGYADNTFDIEGVEDLYENLLSKPFDITKLIERVHTALTE